VLCLLPFALNFTDGQQQIGEVGDNKLGLYLYESGFMEEISISVDNRSSNEDERQESVTSKPVGRKNKTTKVERRPLVPKSNKSNATTFGEGQSPKFHRNQHNKIGPKKSHKNTRKPAKNQRDKYPRKRVGFVTNKPPPNPQDDWNIGRKTYNDYPKGVIVLPNERKVRKGQRSKTSRGKFGSKVKSGFKGRKTSQRSKRFKQNRSQSGHRKSFDGKIPHNATGLFF